MHNIGLQSLWALQNLENPWNPLGETGGIWKTWEKCFPVTFAGSPYRELPGALWRLDGPKMKGNWNLQHVLFPDSLFFQASDAAAFLKEESCWAHLLAMNVTKEWVAFVSKLLFKKDSHWIKLIFLLPSIENDTTGLDVVKWLLLDVETDSLTEHGQTWPWSSFCPFFHFSATQTTK